MTLKIAVIVFVSTTLGLALAQSNCTDKINNCVAYGADICNGTYHDWAKLNCGNYCGFCLTQIAVPTIGPQAPTAGSCKDRLHNCDQYGKNACYGAYITWARQHCAAYCGYCGGNYTQTHTMVSTNHTCIYNGHRYHQNQVWKDGCGINCRCIDSSIGLYHCTYLCQNVTNIPKGCTLFTPPGECCMKLRCNDLTQALQVLGLPANTTLQPVAPTNRTGNHSMVINCMYKGKVYHKGESWEDGCDYRCTCEDDTRGLSTCRSRCLSWHLPPACHLEAPPQGKCCAIPRCPAGYVINYPENYVQE